MEVGSRETSQHNKEEETHTHTHKSVVYATVCRGITDSDGETTKTNHRDVCNHQNEKDLRAVCFLFHFHCFCLFSQVHFVTGEGSGMQSINPISLSLSRSLLVQQLVAVLMGANTE